MNGKPFIDATWIGKHLDDIVEKLGQHLQLLILPMLAGFAIALILGILALRRPSTVGPVTMVTGLLYTIPSLAAFAVLRPIFGLSLWTAVIPLATYTLLILYRNIVAGLRSVPPEVHEAAIGMGYSDRTRLWRVELPLAVPLIMAGVRLAAVTTIGLVTVAAVIGADKFGGFGQFITEGLQTNFPTKIYLGAVLSVVLAFVVDGLLVVLERRLTPWARARAARG
ncbi:MAG: ABC transporter permease [Chloroflexota bacterium]